MYICKSMTYQIIDDLVERKPDSSFRQSRPVRPDKCQVQSRVDRRLGTEKVGDGDIGNS